MQPNDTLEWLEADGLGGFASGTASGVRTRRYHALLLVATTPPTGRVVLVNGLDAWVEIASGACPLSSQAYEPGVIHPAGRERIERFTIDPWPRWRFRLTGGLEVEQEIFVPRGSSRTVISWRLVGKADRAMLVVRPFLSGRDYHATHRQNAGFRFDAEALDDRVIWRPYDGVPAIVALTNGSYRHAPEWYRNFSYAIEGERGLDSTEDLATPGAFRWDLTRGEALLLLAPGSPETDALTLGDVERLRRAELKRRKRFSSPLHRSADGYLVRRGEGRTIIAGYPWFTDWGRDTFIALRGLCLSTGRLAEAREILIQWTGSVSEGMLPNRFPDSGEQPEYNSVDASLWYIVAAGEYLQAMAARKRRVAAKDRRALEGAMEAILDGCSRGTRHAVRMDADGLLAAGVPGLQLTWMDAKIGEWVVTPRIGKPVEVQALWLNALKIGADFSDRWQAVFARGCASFAARFWNEERGCLYDVVDPNGHAAAADPTLRPNQIFAVGGLPLAILSGERARRVVDVVEDRLWTPLGLRSLAPGEPGYTPRYVGDGPARDAAYHQGTVWPWLAGPFVEAWVRVRGSAPDAKREARRRFLAPLLAHLNDAGLGHVSEIADAEPPHTPRGCPFQAWSLGELIRLSLDVLA